MQYQIVFDQHGEEIKNRTADSRTSALLQRKTILSGVTRLTKVVHMSKKNNNHVCANVLLSVTQLSATSTSRVAFMQCLRWGIWCPFQEPDDWKGEEIQLVLQGGAKPNPHSIMVYRTQTSAKAQIPSPLSTADTAQVTPRVHLLKEQNGNSLFEGSDFSPALVFLKSLTLSALFFWHMAHWDIW